MEVPWTTFYETLSLFPFVKATDKYGLQDATISFMKNKAENSLLDLFLFNSSGICLFRKKFNNPIENYDKFLLIVKNLSVSLFQQGTTKSSFYFETVHFSKFKLYFLFKSNIIFVGLFNRACNNSYGKLLLTHLFVALINFKGDTIEKVNHLSTNNNKKVFDTIQSFLTRTKDDIQDFKTTDLFEFLIFEQYFLKSLCLHFKKLSEDIFVPEDMNLSYIKFKNMYVIDVQTETILFDWLKLQHSKKMNKLYNNTKLWGELMYHSKQMMELYVTDHRNFFSNTDSTFRFVKFECTSTFPRMTFIIKFLPLLKGLAVIHVYSQKKLSRLTENAEQPLTKGYKEIDLLFGCEIKTNANLDFRYSEPKKLQQIEKFLVEFLISIRNIDIFRDPNLNRELKYFNYTIISAINSVPSDNGNSTIESLLNKINAKLHEIYNLMKTGGKTIEKTISINSKILGDIEKSENLLFIQKEDILKDLFENNVTLLNIPIDSNKKKRKSKSLIGTDRNGGNRLNDSLDLSRIEEPLNGNVTIDQSQDMSVIISNGNIIKKNVTLKKEALNLNKLIDMSSIVQNTVCSHVGDEELIKPKRSGNRMINDIEGIKMNGSPQLNIKVPNPQEDNPSTKRQQKLILLDEKENNIPNSLRELLPNKMNQQNIKVNDKHS